MNLYSAFFSLTITDFIFSSVKDLSAAIDPCNAFPSLGAYYPLILWHNLINNQKKNFPAY